jgi:hypothetical protein
MWWLLSSIASAQPEVCNGLDDDGDGRADEAPLWWAPDVDGDGHGWARELIALTSCDEDADQLLSVTDCDDDDPASFAGAAELCNGADDDCDGEIDEGACPCPLEITDTRAWQICTTTLSWEAARDACEADGFTLPVLLTEADEDELYGLVAPLASVFWLGITDAAVEGEWVWVDGAPAAYTDWRTGEPNNGFYQEVQHAVEHCAEIEPAGQWDDQQCSLLKPYACEAPCTSRTWHVDSDGDGLGDPATERAACAGEPGEVLNAADCDDQDATLPAVWWTDTDGDGFGGTEGAVACEAQGVLSGGDCDDGNELVSPEAPEVCNGLDDDCQGGADDGEGGPWWPDTDGDGFGALDAVPVTTLCPPGEGWISTGGDCDDGDISISPSADDVPGDGLDSDCDGYEGPSPDTDGDGLTDLEEGLLGTDPERADSDGDMLTDPQELALGTDPNDPDSDGDGRLDGLEGSGDTDGDGLIDPLDPDDDGDGLPTAEEVQTDPLDPDSDDDGVLDGADPSPLDAGKGPALSSLPLPDYGCGCASRTSKRTSGGQPWMAVLLLLLVRRVPVR